MDKLTQAIIVLATTDNNYHDNIVYQLLVDYRSELDRAFLPGRTSRFFRVNKINNLQRIKRLIKELSGNIFPIF